MYKPKYTITPELLKILIELEGLRVEINHLPITPKVLASLRETSRLASTHYSTAIEGNRLTEEQVTKLITENEHFPGKERDEKEVLGYFASLEYVESLIKDKKNITENYIQEIHAIVMSAGKIKVASTPYRIEQNVIRDSLTRKIVYLPPEAKDVPKLMKDLVHWLNESDGYIPCPIRAAVAHYQFATIHPYLDGNGRTARLLATLVLHLCGYGLKGIYSLDAYYSNNLIKYYEALTIGDHHNYYFGREDADITSWLIYFCSGMLESFINVKKQAIKVQKKEHKDLSENLRKLNPKQRLLLTMFEKIDVITTKDIERVFKVKSRNARAIAQKFVKDKILEIENPAKKSRTYILADKFKKI